MTVWLKNWNCDICHENRPDAKISILSKPIKGFKLIEATHNIKYCNDREGCRYGAENLEIFSDAEETQEDH